MPAAPPGPPREGFARGTVVQRAEGGPYMLVVNMLPETVAVVVVEGHGSGTVRLREFPVWQLVQVLPPG